MLPQGRSAIRSRLPDIDLSHKAPVADGYVKLFKQKLR